MKTNKTRTFHGLGHKDKDLKLVLKESLRTRTTTRTNTPDQYALAYPEGVRGIQLLTIDFWNVSSYSCAH